MKKKNSILFLIVFECLSAFAQKINEPADSSNTYSTQFLPFNTKSSENSPFFYKDGIIFCSNRDNNLGVIYTSEDTDQPLTDIYYTFKKNEKWVKPIPISPLVNSKMSEGPFSITKDGSKMYFTRNDVSGNHSKLNIYESELINNTWSEAKYSSINSDKYSYGHPAISPSGSFMVFVSNMPGAGGRGGTDLYISYLKEGKWTRPKNLGSPINTGGNEINPYVGDNGILYFASDGHKGAGGFDLYKVFYNQFEWRGLKNMGHPFNTPSNDFGLVMSEDLNSGYFSSNRLHGGNDDDIYYFQKADSKFKDCDTLQKQNLCLTFFEESSIETDESLPLIYEWNFGDGHKKRGNEVRYCYPKPGQYTVQLNIVDMISDQVFMNEATYELDLQPILTAYFELPDSILAGKEYILDASKSVVQGAVPSSYVWDFGLGDDLKGVKQSYLINTPGEYTIKLKANSIDSALKQTTSCVLKKVLVLNKTDWDYNVMNNKFKDKLMTATAKTVYSIKDSEGNQYKIQLGTSQNSAKNKFKKLEGAMNIEEYYDRNVYGYTTGSFSKPLDAYRTLKKIRKIGFKEAVLIATKNGKVTSGTDSSFFINLPTNFVPIKLVTLKGKITDKNGKRLHATIKWESLSAGDSLGKIICDNTGEFIIDLPDGDLYGYYASYKGYFPASNHLDLRLDNDLSEVNNDIILYEAGDLANKNNALPVNNIFFGPESFEIQSESYSELERLAIFIKENPNYIFEIGGHTDHSGNAQYNLTLSQSRATAVLNYLIKSGCSYKSLVAKGYGNSKPATTNKKLVELNRRVEIKIFTSN